MQKKILEQKLKLPEGISIKIDIEDYCIKSVPQEIKERYIVYRGENKK